MERFFFSVKTSLPLQTFLSNLVMHAKQSHCLISAVFVSDTGQQTIIKTWQHDNLHDQSICRWIWVSMTMLKIQTVIGNWSIILCQLLTGIIQYNHTKKEVGYFLEKWKIISCKFDVDCLNVVWSTIMVWHGLTLEQGKCSHWHVQGTARTACDMQWTCRNLDANHSLVKERWKKF